MFLRFDDGNRNFLVESLLVMMLTQPQIARAFSDELGSFGREPNSYMDGNILMTTFVYDAFACQILCLREIKCLSWNFDKQANEDGNHLCELLDKVKQRNWLISTDRFDFYDFHLKLPLSCSHAKSLGYRESKIYTIDVDGREENIPPFQVFCDMRDKDGVGVTVVSHDSENRTLVSGCEDPGCYRRDVHYDGISDVIAQLGGLARVSANCEQYIKYECHGSMITFAWLVSRDGRRLNYWGGAAPNSTKCACGVAGNCVGGHRCNCDINALRWEEDSGFLSHKNDLPITVLRFGDATIFHNHKEEGYHTLGKLRCYGEN